MEAAQAQSNELILWLKALDLPWWVKVFLVVAVVGILTGAGAILVHGLYHVDKDEIASSVTLFAITLPIVLIVMALVFGDSGEAGLLKRSARVLESLVPDALHHNLDQDASGTKRGKPASTLAYELTKMRRGCCADYCLEITPPSGEKKQLHFSVELNVRKANVVFWLPAPAQPVESVRAGEPALADLVGASRMHCIQGALKEGYELNPSPVLRRVGGAPKLGLVFIRFLSKDFLLHPQDTLYFAQDLAFFIRGMALDKDCDHDI